MSLFIINRICQNGWVVALTQGSSMLIEYSNIFHTLSCRENLHEEKHITVGRFKRDLRENIWDLIALASINSTVGAYQASLNAERLLQNNSIAPLCPFKQQSICTDTTFVGTVAIYYNHHHTFSYSYSSFCQIHCSVYRTMLWSPCYKMSSQEN